MSAAFGLLGAVVGDAMDANDRDVLNAHLQEQGFDIKKFVKDEFRKKLAATPMFGDKLVDGDSQHVFKLVVERFALDKTATLDYRPGLVIIGTLEDGEGNLLWKRRAFTTSFNSDVPSHSFDEYLKGDVLAKNIELAAQTVITELVQDFDNAQVASN